MKGSNPNRVIGHKKQRIDGRRANRHLQRAICSVETLERRVLMSTISVNSTADSAGSSMVRTLRWAINQADGDSGSTIEFDSSVFTSGTLHTITLGSDLPDISVNTTIDGLGSNVVAVSGNNTTRVFKVNSGVTATIENLTVTDGSESGNGGGILTDGGTLTLSQCTISNNSASGGGGGIDSNGVLTADNDTISGNTGYYGGGIYSNGATTISECTISGDSATERGGGIYSYAGGDQFLMMTDCTITGDSVTGAYRSYESLPIPSGGGGVFSATGGSGYAYIGDCTISGDSSGAEGGGVFCSGQDSPQMIENDIICDNTATSGSGGGFRTYTLSVGLTVDLEGDTIDGNTGLDGGGISDAYTANTQEFNDVLTVDHCTILDNSATGSEGAGFGGAMKTDGVATVTFCMIGTADEPNTANVGGGGLTCGAPGVLSASNDTISGNTAPEGGGIRAVGYVVLTNCSITDNSATDGNGGGIDYDGDTLTVNDCVIAGDSDSDGKGGGIYGGSGVDLTVTNSAILEDTVTGGNGGGIYASSGGSLTITACIIEGDESEYGSGGISDHSSGSTIVNSLFDGDQVTVGGSLSYSALGIYGSSTTITNCTFSDNTIPASHSGAAIGGDGTATLTNCIVWGDHVGDSPGTEIGSGISVTVNYSDVELSSGLFAGTDNKNSNPEFFGYGPDPYQLQSDSPCINEGENSAVTTEVDLLGDPRIVDTYVDMGAYEFQNDTLPSYITPSDDAYYIWDEPVGDLTLAGGTLTFTADSATDTTDPTPNLAVTGSDTIVYFDTSQHLAGLSLSDGAGATMIQVDTPSLEDSEEGEFVNSDHHTDHSVLVIGALDATDDPTFSIDASSKLNLEDNDMIIHTGSSDTNGYTELAAIQTLAYGPDGGRDGGVWDGNGLTSSVAEAQDNSDGYESIQLAVVDNTDLEASLSSWTVGSFSEPLGPNDIIVKYTYTGDFNLDGEVTFADTLIFDGYYDDGATTGNEWAHGDTNDDGVLNFTDTLIFDADYGNGTVLAGSPSDVIQL